jgi:glycosyltransferase involved in cell wall biosynthesis
LPSPAIQANTVPMKITVLSHNLSTNAVMRAHRLAVAARHFAEVTMLGPVEPDGPWPALPPEPWIKTFEEKRFPRFWTSLLELMEAADGDVLIAVKPHLASYGAALVAAERRQAPVLLDLDDWDVALAPRSDWARKPSMADLRRPASAIYLSLLTRAIPGASAVTVASTALQQRFGGTLVPHGCLTELFEPAGQDVAAARREFGFDGPTVLFAGTPRAHKGLKPLAKAVSQVPGARLAVLCRSEDLIADEWTRLGVLRIPMLPYAALPRLLAAADVVAIPQLDTEAARCQMPMKVYDCMAMAKPIVASAISDLPVTLAGCGRLVPPGDVDRLAGAISDLLKDPKEAHALGERARQRCLQEFTMRHVADKLGAVVNQLLAGP